MISKKLIPKRAAATTPRWPYLTKQVLAFDTCLQMLYIFKILDQYTTIGSKMHPIFNKILEARFCDRTSCLLK